MCAHVLTDAPFTKGAYSLAVFVALLQPLPAAVSLRRLFPWDWFLPLVFTDRRRTAVAPESQTNILTPDPVKQVN